MAETKAAFAICPVEDCIYAVEFDPDANLWCPSCDMELVPRCPACQAHIESEDQAVCRACTARLKE